MQEAPPLHRDGWSSVSDTAVLGRVEPHAIAINTVVATPINFEALREAGPKPWSAKSPRFVPLM